MSQKSSANSATKRYVPSSSGGPAAGSPSARTSTSKVAGGGGKGKAKVKARIEEPKVEEAEDEEGEWDEGGGGGGGGASGSGSGAVTDGDSDEDDEEAMMLADIRQKSDAFHAKRAKKASQQHDEFRKTIAETLAGVKRDIEDTWAEDEEAVNKAMARLEPFLAPEELNMGDYARAHSARGVIWNSLGHLYQEGVDEAINIVQDEDNAHLAEIEARPAEIKRARKKAIQLAQKEVAEVHEEVSAITDGHDLIRAWSLVLKPHPASLAGRTPAGKKKKSRLGGGLYGGASVGGARKLGMKKLRGVGAGAKGGGGGSGVV